MDNLSAAHMSKVPTSVRLKLAMKKESFRFLIKKLAQKSPTERDVALETIKDTAAHLAKIASENGNQKEFLREAVIALGNIRSASAIPFLKSIILNDDINFLENLAIIALGEKKTAKILISILKALRYKVNYRVIKSIIERGLRKLSVITNPKEREIAKSILTLILKLDYSKRPSAIKAFLKFLTAIINPKERRNFTTHIKYVALMDNRFHRILKKSTPVLRRAAKDLGVALKEQRKAVFAEFKKIIQGLFHALKLHSNRNSWLLIQNLAIISGRKECIKAFSTAIRLLYQLDKAALKLLVKNNFYGVRYLSVLKPKERKAIILILKICANLPLSKRAKTAQIIGKFLLALKDPKTKEVFQVLAKLTSINDPRRGFWAQLKMALRNLVNIIAKKWTLRRLRQETNTDKIEEKIILVEAFMLKDRETWLSIKRLAIAALGRIGNEHIRNKSILPFLMRAAKDPSLTRVALGTLIQLQKEVLSPENLKDLTNLLVETILYSDDFGVRRTATLMLGALNDRRAIPSLIRMLSNYIKLDSKESKLTKTDPSIIAEDPLLQVIYNRTAGKQSFLFAIHFLARFRDNRAIKPLMLLAKREPKLRPPIFLALKHIITKSSVPILSKLLNSKDAFLRRFTVMLLGFSRDYTVVLPLLKQLVAKLYDGTVPRSAILKIFGRRDTSWKQFFVNTNEKYLEFKPNAAALIKSARINEGTRKKLLAIFNQTPKPDPIVIKEAIIALTRLSRFSGLKRHLFAKPLIEKYKTPSTNYNNKILILKALGNVGSGVALPFLFLALKNRDNKIQHAAILALGMLGMRGFKRNLITKILIAKYKSVSNLKTRLMILQSLGFIRSKTSLPFLLPLIKDLNYKIRCAVIFAIGKIGDAKALRILQQRLKAIDKSRPRRKRLRLRDLYLKDEDVAKRIFSSDGIQPPKFQYGEITHLEAAIRLLQKRLQIDSKIDWTK
jgi:HEAT repeat protein